MMLLSFYLQIIPTGSRAQQSHLVKVKYRFRRVISKATVINFCKFGDALLLNEYCAGLFNVFPWLLF